MRGWLRLRGWRWGSDRGGSVEYVCATVLHRHALHTADFTDLLITCAILIT